MVDTEYADLLEESRLIQSSNYEVERAIIQQIEFVRRQHGLNHSQFSALLGIPKNSYSKITSDQSRNIPFLCLLTFCRLFGYDLTQLYNESFLETADSVVRELAILLTTLSDDTIDTINSVIAQSQEPENRKEYTKELLEQIKKIEKPNNYFFAADYKEADK